MPSSGHNKELYLFPVDTFKIKSEWSRSWLHDKKYLMKTKWPHSIVTQTMKKIISLSSLFSENVFRWLAALFWLLYSYSINNNQFSPMHVMYCMLCFILSWQTAICLYDIAINLGYF